MRTDDATTVVRQLIELAARCVEWVLARLQRRVWFVELVRTDGEPVMIRCSAIESVRRDGNKGCVVAEFGHGRYELIRTPYMDVAKALRPGGAE